MQDKSLEQLGREYLSAADALDRRIKEIEGQIKNARNKEAALGEHIRIRKLTQMARDTRKTGYELIDYYRRWEDE